MRGLLTVIAGLILTGTTLGQTVENKDLQQQSETVQILYERARLDYNRCQQDYAELVLLARKVNAENEKLKELQKEVKK